MAIDLNRLREIGWSEWDPIGLLGNRDTWRGAPFEDDYDDYLIHVADRLIAGDDEAELAAYLVTIVRENMGLGTSDLSKNRAAATVAAIKAHVEEALPEQPQPRQSIKELVESRFPGWRVVENGHRQESAETHRPAYVQPDIESLRAKWFGSAATGAEEVERERMTGLVVIEPLSGGGPGRKTIVVKDGKIIGAQG
ncbi:hypothetical protein [Rhizobium laguerreae]|uniref:hypothetical protein n=1 Tax=Rhizobium laguerreae TaxID=1076926 RepID=UPI001C91367C|nr:hypothetical protein [Rhizobium laguerreae]